MRLVAILAGLLTSSCFLATDLDRFQSEKATELGNFLSLRVTVRGMTSHVTERIEYRVVDGSNVIQFRGLIIPLGGPAATFTVPNAVPRQNGPFRLDFFADHDFSGAYDLRPDTTLDHAWRLPLDETILDDTGTYVVVFDHNTSFTNLNTPSPPTEVGKNAIVHLRNLGAVQGKKVEVRVADASTQRVVAMFRVPALQTPDSEAKVDGMIEPGVTYNVEVYVDDAAAPAYRLEQLATDAGIEATING